MALDEALSIIQRCSVKSEVLLVLLLTRLTFFFFFRWEWKSSTGQIQIHFQFLKKTNQQGHLFYIKQQDQICFSFPAVSRNSAASPERRLDF